MVPSPSVQSPDGPTLAGLGESGVLARIFPHLPQASATLLGPGDDAAVVAAADGRVVATTDLVVEGRDWRPDWSSAYDVGWKVAAQNLADVAAMGAVPTGLLVGLVAPGHTPVAWLEQLADGLAAACAGTGASVVGGDLSGGEPIVVAVTALGDLQGRSPVLRSGAWPGDLLALAGSLGRADAGLQLLREGRADLAPELVEAHRRPAPPYDRGPAAAVAGAHALMDVSDGLLLDAGRLAAASGVRIDLDCAALHHLVAPLEATAGALGDADRALRWVLTGGEDHALLAAFAPGALPDGFRAIGRIGPAGVEGVSAVTLDGVDPSTVVGAYGWDHYGADPT